MKRIISIIVVLSVIVGAFSITLAEELNLGNMSFSELTELKRNVDMEYYSRNESEPFTLVTAHAEYPSVSEKSTALVLAKVA